MRKIIFSLMGFALAAGLSSGAQSPAVSEEKAAAPEQQATETPKRSGFRRTTFLYTRPRGIFGSAAGRVSTAAPRHLFGSRREARQQRLAQQQERMEQGFSSRFAPSADTNALSAKRLQESFAPTETAKPTGVRQPGPGEFRPTIYGLN
ncbi:MAG: hypothetical protein ABJF23_06680 [Bryobacteraceae bacterium]